MGNEGLLKVLADEWGKQSKIAQTVQDRKRAMRETLEPIFESIIPKLNRELKEAGSGYHFREDQHAGYTAAGPISFELYPDSIEKWRAIDEHHGLVDYDRAKGLEKFVNESKCVSEFKALFPHIQISITANYCGFFDEEEA